MTAAAAVVVHLPLPPRRGGSPPSSPDPAPRPIRLVVQDEEETWSSLAARCVESHMLQRPPPSGLLGWLSDLSSSRSSPARRGRRFTLRYGDGRASVVRVVWRHDGEDEEGEGDAVEANVTLRFRAGEEGGEDLPPSGIVLGSFSGSEKSIEVELRAKLIGSPGDDSGGSAIPLPMDDAKTHVLTVREHPRFLGAVDSYSLTRLVDDDCTVTTITTTPAAARSAARSATAPPTRPPAETTDGPPRKARKEATKRKDGEESAASPKGQSKKSPNKKTNGESTKKDKEGAANEAEDRPKRPPNGYMMFSMERRREEENLSRKITAKEIAEMYHALADEERKKYNDEAREALEKFKKEHPDLSKSVRTKRKKKADVEVENMAEAGDKGKKAAEEGEEKEGAAGSAKMRGEEQEDGPTEAKVKVKVKDAEDRPKRPPNGYIRFNLEVRGKVVEEHPEWKVGEVAKKVGEMYRALTDEERAKYNDAAREAMERFKEEHPDLPKSPRKKRKKKEEEEAKLVETEATATAGKKGVEEKEKGEAKAMGSEAQEATEVGEEKERKAGSPKKRGKGEEDKANGSAIEVPREKEAGTKKEGSGKKKSKRGEENETLSKVDSEKKKRKKKKKGDAGEDNAKDKSKAKKEKVRSSKKKKKKDDSKERRKSKEEENEEEEDSPPKGNADVISPTNTDAGEEGTETGRPKRPLNAYMRFANERRSQMMVDHPGARQSEITKLLGEVYRSLDDEEKQPYKDAAAAALAKFKKEHGDEVHTYDTKKRKKQRKEDEARGAKSDEDNGAKRPSKRVRSSSISSHHARGGYDHIPPEPATGLPEGWIMRKVPRAKVESIKDHYYFSPGSSYRFRSMTEVGRFRACVDRANGDETRGIELYLAEKPERSKRGSDESGKKGRKEKVGVAAGGNEGA